MGDVPVQAGRASASPADTESAWRAALLEVSLGLLFGAVIVSGLLGTFLPRPRFDMLSAVFFGLAALTGAAWRLRRLPRAVRIALAFLPLLVLEYELFTRIGFVVNLTTILVLAALLVSLWLGPRQGLAYVGLCGAALLAAGYRVTTTGARLDSSFTDPGNFANWFRADVTFVILGWGLIALFSWIIQRVEKNARERAEAHDLLRVLNRRLENAKEEERRHLARELHDEFGQSLTAIKLQLKLASRGSHTMAQNIESATGVVDELIRRVRQLSVDLSPPLLQEAGLVEAVRAFVDSQSGLGGLEVQVDIDVDVEELSEAERLSSELETTAFRVVQESVTNVLLHADASHIRVRLRREGSALQVSVVDDGRGYDVSDALRSAARGEHFGVLGMRERVRGLNGSFVVDSRAGQGTSVTATFPVAAPV
jgi:signal transduction histidine kinase